MYLYGNNTCKAACLYALRGTGFAALLVHRWHTNSSLQPAGWPQWQNHPNTFLQQCLRWSLLGCFAAGPALAVQTARSFLCVTLAGCSFQDKERLLGWLATPGSVLTKTTKCLALLLLSRQALGGFGNGIYTAVQRQWLLSHKRSAPLP